MWLCDLKQPSNTLICACGEEREWREGKKIRGRGRERTKV